MGDVQYNGVEFSVRQTSDKHLPRWLAKGNYVDHAIPFGGHAVTEFTGRENDALVITAIFTSLSDMDTVLGANASGYSGTLSYLGNDYADTRLESVDGVEQWFDPDLEQGYATLTFKRAGDG